MIIVESFGSKDAARTYLVSASGRKEAILIDPASDLESILARVKQDSLGVRAILLTHGHLRHAARAQEAAVRLGCKIGAHVAELPALQQLPSLAEQSGLCGVKAPLVESLLKDKDVMSFGDIVIEVLETPGHSIGDISFHIESQWFVGDLCERSPHDAVLWEESLRKLIRRIGPSGKIHPGHGFPFDAKELSTYLPSSKKGRK
ncbi:MAG TPA: MBL fold metallo-hydrolase [Bdellovibrionota bacterium]|nr:MBL fold metallo-hydrolase [Bdellovibrionota bacterium]